MKELKKFVIGTLVDVACIGAMVMQALNPGTFWDYLGPVGYAFQIIMIWMGLVFGPLFLLRLGMLRDLPRPRTEPEQRMAENLAKLQNRSIGYVRCILARELGFCVVFSGMGWIWLALGNLLALYLISRIWLAPKMYVQEVA